jgi:uncharacterized protein YqhQ
VITPGLWLQKLTTRQPDDGQLEVALAAFQAVLLEDEASNAEPEIEGSLQSA